MEYLNLMRRILKLSVLCIAAGVVGACRPDQEIPTENIPTAGVRFINAVPDTLPLDFRFVDFVESNAHFRIAFRNSPVTTAGVTASTQVQYKNARAGSRQYKVFLNDTLQSVASFEVRTGTLDLTAGQNYTVLMWGWAAPSDVSIPRVAGSQALQLTVINETVADPGAQVALRVINTTRNPIDVSFFPTTGAGCTGTAPGAPQFANVGAATTATGISTYVLANPDTMCFRVQPAGGGTSLFADSRALLGQQPSGSGVRPCGGAAPQPKCDIEATPGTTVAGSAVTALVFPGSTACSRAPQASPFQFTTGNTPNLSARDGAVTSGFARIGGSFTTDGIANGQIIGVCGFTNPANNGLFNVTGVTATTITATKVGGGNTVLEAGTTGNTTGVLGANALGYTRATGSFVTDGFVVGMTVTASGFTVGAGGTSPNNGLSVITAVTPTQLTVTKTPATVLDAATTGSIAMAANGTTSQYTRSAGSFVTDGWQVGQLITASGFVNAANNGGSVVTAVTAGALTVTKAGGLVTEVELPGRTIASSTNRTIANATNRQIAAERPFISFIWDRRPPRHPDIQ